MMVERLTKRRFLKGVVSAGGVLAFAPLLAACGSATAPTPAPAKPTEAPKPAAGGEPTKATEAPKPTAAAKPTEAAKPAEAPKPTSVPAAKPGAAKEPVTIRLHLRGGGEQSEPAIYVMRPDEWAQETGNKVKREEIVGDYVGKVLALAAGNTLGDVMFTGESLSQHSRFVRGNLIEPVEDYLGPFNVKKTEYVQAIVDTLTYNGKMYGLPKCGHPGACFIAVNLKMLDEAGIKRPQPDGSHTFADVSSWAVKLAKGPAENRDVYGYRVEYSEDGARAVCHAMGSQVISDDGMKSLADSDPVYEWAKWSNQFINVDKVHPAAAALQGQGVEGVFAAGKLAMFQIARSVVRPIRLAVKDKFEWGVIMMPRAAKPVGWGSRVDTHSVTTQSKHKDVAFSLIYAMADRRFAYLVAKEQGYLTGRVDNMEAIKELASDPFLQLQAKAGNEEAAFNKAKNLRTEEFWTAWTNHMDLLWLGKRQLDKAFMAELKKVTDEVLAKPA